MQALLMRRHLTGEASRRLRVIPAGGGLDGSLGIEGTLPEPEPVRQPLSSHRPHTIDCRLR